MWLGVIIYGVVAMHAAGLSESSRQFPTEDDCWKWVGEAIAGYVAVNSTKDDPAHQVLASGFCVVAPTRDS